MGKNQKATQAVATNKDSLVDYIAASLQAQGTKVTKKLAGQVFDALFEGIETSLANGIPVKINGYVDFGIKETAERTARNPQNGDPVHVPAGRKVHARAMSRLKTAVSGE